jgi:MoxR-like ATPase
MNLLLVGPAGTGKTTIAQQLSQLLGVPFGSISCSQGMSEAQLTGWLLPLGKKGKFDYKSAPFVDCMQMPAVFLVDEIGGADANTFMALNSMLANGFMSIPH